MDRRPSQVSDPHHRGRHPPLSATALLPLHNLVLRVTHLHLQATIGAARCLQAGPPAPQRRAGDLQGLPAPPVFHHLQARLVACLLVEVLPVGHHLQACQVGLLLAPWHSRVRRHLRQVGQLQVRWDLQAELVDPLLLLATVHHHPCLTAVAAVVAVHLVLVHHHLLDKVLTPRSNIHSRGKCRILAALLVPPHLVWAWAWAPCLLEHHLEQPQACLVQVLACR
mmetsp:Transcript_11828/g.26075  ORF Transcript_11828/g.26075 Transcript_11828/m.26075 type:complete len:224 (+) Transcript_11828:263-934(+)